MLYKLVRIFQSFSKFERFIFGGAIIVLVISGFFWLANYYLNVTEKAPVRGGHYKEGIVGQPVTLNPILAGTNDVDRDLIELLFADLSGLAENIKISKDNKTWTITLKDKLEWTDGKPLTTADVLFTLESFQNPDAQSPSAATWQGVIAERLSDKEIRFSLPNPYAFFEDNLRKLKIVPRHIFASIPLSNLRLSSFNLEPVGSGPYKFVSYQKRKDGFISQYYLEANDQYADEAPYIQSFTIKFFNNANEALESFNRREIHGLGAIDPKNLGKIKVGYQLFSINVPRYYAIFLNQSTEPALKKAEIREILDNAIDKSKLIENVFKNHATIVNGPIPSIIDGYNPEIYKSKQIDIENAKNILNKAGLKEIGAVIPQIQFLIDAAELIKADWEKIGLTFNYQVATLQEMNEVIKTRNYQTVVFGNILRGNPDVFSFWHSSERFYPGLNLAIYSNKKVDNLLEAIRKDFNPESRKTNLSKLQQLIYDDKPAIFLFSPNYLYAAPKILGGLDLTSAITPSDRFEKVNEWYLRTARVFK